MELKWANSNVESIVKIHAPFCLQFFGKMS